MLKTKFLSICFYLCVILNAHAVAATPTITLPYTLENKRVGIDVQLGDQALHMLLDTGASTTVFFENVRPFLFDYQSESETKVLFPAVNRSINAMPLSGIALTVGGETFSLTRAGDQGFMHVIDCNIYPPNDEDFVVHDATKEPTGSNLRQVIK